MSTELRAPRGHGRAVEALPAPRARQRSASFTMRSLSAALNPAAAPWHRLQVAVIFADLLQLRLALPRTVNLRDTDGFGTVSRPFSAHCNLDYQWELSQVTLAFWGRFAFGGNTATASARSRAGGSNSTTHRLDEASSSTARSIIGSTARPCAHRSSGRVRRRRTCAA